MKITDIKVLGPRSGYVTFVQLETDGGLSGIGSTDAPPPVVAAIIEHGSVSLRSLIVGEDPREPGRLWNKMFLQWQARRGRGSEGGFAVNAMAAIDMALWDIAGKAAGKTIYQLLGGAVQPQVMVYASASRYKIQPDDSWLEKTTEEMARESRSYVQQGFKAIKFGWGDGFDAKGETKLAAIREAIGPDTRLMVDFGCPAYFSTKGWNAKAAIRAARVLEKYSVYFFEEALAPHDVDGFEELSKAVDVKIATGESLTTTAQFEAFINRRALDIVQPDAQQIGITQFDQVARKAEKAGILCVPHCPWSALAIAAHANLLAAESNGVMVEYPAPGLYEDNGPVGNQALLVHLQKLVEKPIQLKDGFLQLPTLPGLGVGGFVPDAFQQLKRIYAQEDRQ